MQDGPATLKLSFESNPCANPTGLWAIGGGRWVPAPGWRGRPILRKMLVMMWSRTSAARLANHNLRWKIWACPGLIPVSLVIYEALRSNITENSLRQCRRGIRGAHDMVISKRFYIRRAHTIAYRWRLTRPAAHPAPPASMASPERGYSAGAGEAEPLFVASSFTR